MKGMANNVITKTKRQTKNFKRELSMKDIHVYLVYLAHLRYHITTGKWKHGQWTPTPGFVIVS